MPPPTSRPLPFAPRRYVAYRAPSPLTVDGKLDEPAWAAAAWSDAFVDIEGDSRPRPRFRTRVKMLWDDEYFYVAAEMEEPDLWGTLTARDSVIFHDNDFEVFIDPDGDTHAYYELEVNALGTPWDLMLIKPYRDGGPAIDAWDIAGLKVGVDVRGTINRPGDRDDGWTRRDRDAVADPARGGARAASRRGRAIDGASTSRASQWQMDVADGRYAKRLKPGTKDPLPENNWVWSPQGAINMHMPERWGFVQFSATAGWRRHGSVRRRSERARQVGAAPAVLSSARVSCTQTGGYADGLDALDAADIRVDGLDVPAGDARDAVALRDRRARVRRRHRPHRPGRPGLGDAVSGAAHGSMRAQADSRDRSGLKPDAEPKSRAQ